MTVRPDPGSFAPSDPRPPGHPAVRSGRIGVLLLNLGTPEGTDYRSMRRYLKEFLSDRRVIETSRLLWWPLLNGVILTTRPGRKGRDYAAIWNNERDEGPLKTVTRAQAEALASSLAPSTETAWRWTGPCDTATRERAIASAPCSNAAATASCWCPCIRNTARPPRRRRATTPFGP
jgi:hypothetical protein